MDKKRVWTILTVVLCMVMVLGVAGCKKNKPPLTTDVTPSTTNETTSGDGLPGVNQEDLLFEPGSKYGLQTVQFDYNSSSLRADSMDTLRGNAEKIKQFPNAYIQIAGHCDERGTQEYNLALGERRALAVRNYLIQLGVSGDRLVTISYGKEFPVVAGSNEEAWAQNRRAEFNKAK